MFVMASGCTIQWLSSDLIVTSMYLLMHLFALMAWQLGWKYELRRMGKSMIENNLIDFIPVSIRVMIIHLIGNDPDGMDWVKTHLLSEETKDKFQSQSYSITQNYFYRSTKDIPLGLEGFRFLSVRPVFAVVDWIRWILLTKLGEEVVPP